MMSASFSLMHRMHAARPRQRVQSPLRQTDSSKFVRVTNHRFPTRMSVLHAAGVS